MSRVLEPEDFTLRSEWLEALRELRRVSDGSWALHTQYFPELFPPST
jgi:hypothetical protein